MQDYREKRDFPRMNVECPAEVRVTGRDEVRAALVKELSGNGLLLWYEGVAAPGAELDITVQPGTDLTPPLNARVRVIRATPIEGTNSCALACEILQKD